VPSGSFLSSVLISDTLTLMLSSYPYGQYTVKHSALIDNIPVAQLSWAVFVSYIRSP